MADQIRATPRSPILGLFSDLVNLPLQYMSAPERTQQSQGVAQFLYGTGIPKTLERASYGDSLFSGAGMTLRPKEETINAAMNVLPFAPVAGRVAGRMIKATEGMPVGMGIKDVSPKIGINVNQGGSSFADKIISGEKKFETRESDSLRSYVGKRVGIIRTGEGKAKAIGDVTLGEPIVVSSPEEFAKLRDLHLVPEGSKFDIKQGGVKYLYPIENPVPYGVEKDVAKYGIVSRKILGESDTLEKALYPQQAALPTQYPLAPAGTRYEEFGGDLTYMTPDEFLQQVRPLQLDAESLDNIAALRSHVESGGKLDPLHIYASGKEDGRHRAYLAKELGIEKVPVALHGQTPTPIESPTFTDPFGNTIGSSIR